MQVVVLAAAHGGVFGTQRQRQQHLGVLGAAQRGQHLARQREGRRQHADDRVRLAVERDGAANDAGVGAESPRPGAVPQHRRAGAARHVVFRQEQSAQARTRAQHRQQVRRHANRADARRIALAGQVLVAADGDGELVERAVALS